ncbi:MAG: DUF2312 domain-containing protein [Sphingomonas sp.]|uniref:DUF2312 domain-containing protein n=1 Tax=Sphingomonas sp. TaxID=28214 RepID=UPI003568EC9E
MRAVPDGNGGFRHVPTPFVPVVVNGGKGKKKKAIRPPDPIVTNGDSAAEQLRLLIERVERIDVEIAEIQADRAEVLGEVKAVGFDLNAFRAIIALRKQEKHHRDEFEGLLETYRVALGLD